MATIDPMNDLQTDGRSVGAQGRSASAPKSRLRVWLPLLIVAVAGAIWFVRPAERQRPAGFAGRDGTPSTVRAVAATAGDINVYLQGLGTVTPLAQVVVKPRVDGQLMRVLFREGQTVAANQPIAEIDSRPFQVQLEQAEGQLAHDEAQLKTAKLDLERYRTLYAQDSIAKQQVDQQDSLVHQYEGSAKSDQAQVDNARLQLAYTHITAPIAGRIGLRQVDAGNMVHASDANGLAVITQLKPVAVLFTVPEDNLPAILSQLKAGNRLPVEAFDRAQRIKLADGSLLTVDNVIDTSTGTVKLKAQFGNQDEMLFPNQFVNVRMLVDVKHGVVKVPVAAVQQGAQGAFVYVLKDDQTVSVRPVKAGVTEGEQVEIADGLKEGEHVVVDGVDKLRDGAKVMLPGAQADPAAPAAPDAAPATDDTAQKHRHRRE